MKIGIFGDSYGDDSWPENKTYHSWIDYLKNDFQVENFSKLSSSLFYSKQLFDQKYTEYDKILFLVTEPGRYFFNCLGTEVENYKHYAGITRLHRHLSDVSLSGIDKKKLKIFRDFIVQVRNFESEEYFHNLMVEDIKIKRNDAILIPCFLNSMPSVKRSLYCISISENCLAEEDGIDRRFCHMNEINNFHFYKNIKFSLLNNSREVDLNF